MTLKEKFSGWFLRRNKTESARVARIKKSLQTANSIRSSQDNKLSEIMFDYPLLLELSKAYIDEEDYESAQTVIRSCFELKDHYAQYGANREAHLIKQLAKDLIKNGREDIAQKILRKVRNFEGGIPLHKLSETFVPDRELLIKAMKEWELENTIQK